MWKLFLQWRYFYTFRGLSVHLHMPVYCIADPEWASYTLGVFVCHSCSGLHRNIAQISKVKSVLLDPWSFSEVEVRTTERCMFCKSNLALIHPSLWPTWPRHGRIRPVIVIILNSAWQTTKPLCTLVFLCEQQGGVFMGLVFSYFLFCVCVETCVIYSLCAK